MKQVVNLNEQDIYSIVEQIINEGMDEGVFSDFGNAMKAGWNRQVQNFKGVTSTVGSAIGNKVQNNVEQQIKNGIWMAQKAVGGAMKATPNNTAYSQCYQHLQNAMKALGQSQQANNNQIRNTAKQASTNMNQAKQQQMQANQQLGQSIKQTGTNIKNGISDVGAGMRSVGSGIRNMYQNGVQQNQAARNQQVNEAVTRTINKFLY